MEILKTSKSFKREFKHQLRLAVVAAIGFSIAFAWRNALFDTFQSYIARLMDLSEGHYTTEIYTAIAMTVCGVLAILLTSKLLRED